jgi:hypothetical protein
MVGRDSTGEEGLDAFDSTDRAISIAALAHYCGNLFDAATAAEKEAMILAMIPEVVEMRECLRS